MSVTAVTAPPPDTVAFAFAPNPVRSAAFRVKMTFGGELEENPDPPELTETLCMRCPSASLKVKSAVTVPPVGRDGVPVLHVTVSAVDAVVLMVVMVDVGMNGPPAKNAALLMTTGTPYASVTALGGDIVIAETKVEQTLMGDVDGAKDRKVSVDVPDPER